MIAMTTAVQMLARDRAADDARQVALTYVGEAFALAALDGIEADALAEAALCAAMCELVDILGEDGAAEVATQLAHRVAAGEFSVSTRQ
jgi:hypothetical protein